MTVLLSTPENLAKYPQSQMHHSMTFIEMCGHLPSLAEPSLDLALSAVRFPRHRVGI